MDKKRYIELSNDFSLNLKKSEIEKGWHWCMSWDGMLVGPNMEESFFCSCDIPELEKWKESKKARMMKQEMENRMDKQDADALNDQFRKTDGE